MLQDLETGKIENQFKNEIPCPEDKVYVFNGREVLIHRDADDFLLLPTIGEIKAKETELQYIFSLEGERHFLYMGSYIQSDLYKYESLSTLRQLKSKDVCFGVMTAFHLYSWYIKNRFCGQCGAKTVHDAKERMLRCPECGNMIFPRISPAVIIAVTNGDKIVLSKYAGRNYSRYALLAGYTEIGETLEQTVEREVMEEVGLKVRNIRYYKSQPWGIDGNVLMGFFCDLDGDETITIDKSELSMAGWYHRSNLPAKDDGISLTREMIRVFEEGNEPV